MKTIREGKERSNMKTTQGGEREEKHEDNSGRGTRGAT